MPQQVELPAADRATYSTVASGVASVTLLAANDDRLGAVIANSDANALLIDLTGGTAAATRFHYRVVQNGTVEVPFGYRGKITGVWEGDGAGAAMVAELT